MTVSRPSRQQIAAAATRREILAAAERLFAGRGYAQTSIADLADEAGVSVPTIYASVGTKKALVLALIEFVGDVAGVAEARRALSEATNPASILRIASGVNRRLLEERGPVVRAIRSAATVEPDVASAYDHAQELHREGAARIARRLEGLGALRSDVRLDEAAAAIELLTSVEAYERLVDLGWSLSRAETWAATALARLLLADGEIAP